MPKRFGKLTSSFLSGVATGKTLSAMSLNFKEYRKSKEMTVEEVAKAAGVSVKFIQGIEDCDIFTYLKSDTEDFMKVARVFDVAIQFGLKSHLSALRDSIEIQPLTFDQEVTINETTI